MITLTSQKSTKGFTLVELMVTVSIIAILTAIVVANLSQARAKSRDAKRVSDVNQIQLALTLFFDRCNSYPNIPLTSTYDATKVSNFLAYSTGCPSGVTFSTFLSKFPTDPTSGVSYLYAVDDLTTPTDYYVGATLETSSSALLDKVGFNDGWGTSKGGFNGTAAQIYDVRSH